MNVAFLYLCSQDVRRLVRKIADSVSMCGAHRVDLDPHAVLTEMSSCCCPISACGSFLMKNSVKKNPRLDLAWEFNPGSSLQPVWCHHHFGPLLLLNNVGLKQTQIPVPSCQCDHILKIPVSILFPSCALPFSIFFFPCFKLHMGLVVRLSTGFLRPICYCKMNGCVRGTQSNQTCQANGRKFMGV